MKKNVGAVYGPARSGAGIPMDLLPRFPHSRSVFHVETPPMCQSDEKPVYRAPKKKHNVFYSQFQLIIIVLTLFGRIALQRNSDGTYKWKWLSWLSLYCFLNYLVQTYLAVQICHQRIDAVFKSRSYDEFIFAIHILAYIQIHFHVPFTYWIQGPKYAQYLNQWTRFQSEWLSVTGEELKLKHRKATIAYVSIIMPSLALLLVMEKYSTLHDPFEFLLPHFFTIGSTACMLGTWYIACLDMAAISKDLTKFLTKKLRSNPDPNFLHRWRNLWISLGSLITDLGNNHFAIMASIFLTYSITFLLGIYNALSKILASDLSLKTFGYLCASGMSILMIYSVCDSGHQASTQVENFTTECILKSPLQEYQEDVRYELELILRCVQTNPPQIRLAGFVTLNRPLFVSFVANTITYLIVILQFKG